jgi:hypothetical protein
MIIFKTAIHALTFKQLPHTSKVPEKHRQPLLPSAITVDNQSHLQNKHYPMKFCIVLLAL